MNYFVSGVGDMEAYEPDWCTPLHPRSAPLQLPCLGQPPGGYERAGQCVNLPLLHALICDLCSHSNKPDTAGAFPHQCMLPVLRTALHCRRALRCMLRTVL